MSQAIASLGWGALAASSLVIGAWLGVARRWPPRLVGQVLAFGAGALMSAVSFELALEGAAAGGPGWVGVGLGAGAVTYYVLAGRLAHTGRPGRRGSGGAGVALALGAFLDGIPEQLVLGMGLASGEGVSLGLIGAIIVSNLPEAVGSASEMRDGSSRGEILRLWAGVATACALATVTGYGLADAAGGELQAAIHGFAAGALVVMLIDSMIPEAVREGGRTAGLLATLGFAAAAGLSSVT